MLVPLLIGREVIEVGRLNDSGISPGYLLSFIIFALGAIGGVWVGGLDQGPDA